MPVKNGSSGKILFAIPNLGNNYDLLTSYYLSLSSEMTKRGFDVTVANVVDSDFFFKLFNVAQDEDAVLFLGHFFYDIRVSAHNHYASVKLADIVKCRIFASIGDHPFTIFMWERLMHMHERTNVFVLDPGYIDAVRLLQPEVDNFHLLIPPIFFADPIAPTPFQDRSIDILIPLSYVMLENYGQIRGRYSSGSDFERLCERAYEALRYNYHEYPLAVFSNIIKEMFSIDIRSTAKENRDLFMKFMNLISRLDSVIRVERRIEMMNDLLKDTGGKKVHIIGNPPGEIANQPNVVPMGSFRTNELGKIMANAKSVVHCHPTYPNGMHERIVNAMANGCAVISDYFPAMADIFRERESWLCWKRGFSINDVFSGISADNLSYIGSEGRQQAWMQFSMSRHADQIMDVILNRKQK